MKGYMIAAVFKFEGKESPALRKRMRAVGREIKSLQRGDALTVDASHLADLAGALEQIASICRRARAVAPKQEGGGGNV